MTFYLVVACNIRYGTKFSSQLTADLIDCIIFNVHSSNEQIVWDVVQMTTEFQPGSSSTDVVSGAFALHLGIVLIKFKDKWQPRSQISKHPCVRLPLWALACPPGLCRATYQRARAAAGGCSVGWHPLWGQCHQLGGADMCPGLGQSHVQVTHLL